MKYILDASSLYKMADMNKLEIIEYSITLDLARYDVGNAVLNDLVHLKQIEEIKACKLIVFLYQVLDTIDQVKITEGEDVLKLATKFKISFYDAAYVYYAKASNTILVTEDEKLRRRIKDYIKVSNIEELSRI